MNDAGVLCGGIAGALSVVLSSSKGERRAWFDRLATSGAAGGKTSVGSSWEIAPDR
jgi:hypothetical protein